MLMLFGSVLRCTSPTGMSSTIITKPTLEISGRCPGMSKLAFFAKAFAGLCPNFGVSYFFCLAVKG